MNGIMTVHMLWFVSEKYYWCRITKIPATVLLPMNCLVLVFKRNLTSSKVYHYIYYCGHCTPDSGPSGILYPCLGFVPLSVPLNKGTGFAHERRLLFQFQRTRYTNKDRFRQVRRESIRVFPGLLPGRLFFLINIRRNLKLWRTFRPRLMPVVLVAEEGFVVPEHTASQVGIA
jgi:hypothetical protein